MSTSVTTTCWGVAICAGLLLPQVSRVGAAVGQNVPVQAPPAAPAAVLPAAPAPAVAAPKPPLYSPGWTQLIDAVDRPIVGLGATAVIVASRAAAIEARALDDGRVLWTSPVITATPLVIARGVVYVRALEAVHALDEGTGASRWTVSLPAPDTGITLNDDRLLLPTGRDVVAVELATGHERWRQPLGSPATTAVAVDGPTAFVALEDHSIVAMETATGTIRWRSAPDYAPVALLASRGRVTFGTRTGQVCSIDQRLGREVWCFDFKLPVVGAPLADDRYTYFAVRDYTLRALARDGAMRRRDQFNARPITGPWPSGPYLVVPLSNGELVVMNASDGKVAARIAAAGIPAGLQPSLEAFTMTPTGDRGAAVFSVPGGQRTLVLYVRKAAP